MSNEFGLLLAFTIYFVIIASYQKLHNQTRQFIFPNRFQFTYIPTTTLSQKKVELNFHKLMEIVRKVKVP